MSSPSPTGLPPIVSLSNSGFQLLKVRRSFLSARNSTLGDALAHGRCHPGHRAIVILCLQNVNLVHSIATAEYPRAFVAKSIRNLLTDQSRAAQRRVAAIQNYGMVAPRSYQEPRIIHEVLEGLTAEERAMLYRRFWYQQSLGEIAEAQGLPYSTVAKRMFRLLAKLREQVGDVQ